MKSLFKLFFLAFLNGAMGAFANPNDSAAPFYGGNNYDVNYSSLFRGGAGGGLVTTTTVGAQAISVKSGTLIVAAAGVAAMTLAAPIAGDQADGGDDGKILRIVSATAQAHTVTQAAPGFNGGGAASDVATFAAAIGNNLQLMARNGVWLVISQVGITLA